MVRTTIYVDKPYEDWTFEEKLEAIHAVFAYLKNDGIRDPLDERKRTMQTQSRRNIQYVSHHVSHEIEGKPYGFEDELVYVGRSFTTNERPDRDTGQKCFVGCHWHKGIESRLRLLDDLYIDDIRGALFMVMMHAGHRGSLRL